MKAVNGALAAIVLWGSVIGAQSADTVTSAARQSVESYGRRMVAAVEAMPADKFGSTPTSGQQEFSHLVAHMVNFNTSRCAFIAGLTPAPDVTGKEPKDELVAALKSSFAFCSTELAKLRDADLGTEGVFSPTRKASRAELLIHIVGTEYDHYAQAAGYLRAAGVTFPPPR